LGIITITTITAMIMAMITTTVTPMAGRTPMT
jgi:hypothetical protein